jgi:hypothetical protein
VCRGRDETDIEYAMDKLGYTHPYGRPLNAVDPSNLTELVDRVTDRVDQNPYRSDRGPIDRSKVEEAVRSHYLDIQPWPFQALH